MSDTSIVLRRARPEDVDLVWRINNDPTVRERAVNSEPIDRDEHSEWFEGVMEDPDRFLYVVVVDGRDCGVIRFDRETGSGTAYVSVALAPETRGRGIGTEVIRTATESMLDREEIDRVLAEVRPDNPPSRKAFIRAGYRKVDRRTRSGVTLDIYSCVRVDESDGADHDA